MFQDKQGELGDLHKKSTFEIKELLRRQEKLLSNRSFLDALPDKGAKVRAFSEKLLSILREQEDVEGMTGSFGTLSLTVKEKPTKDTPLKKDGGLSDVLVDKCQTFHSNIFAKPLQEEGPKFRPNRTLKSTAIPGEITKPAENKRGRRTDKNREVTAAYSITLKNEASKPLDLSESLRLQLIQQEKLERLKAEQATEKLTQRLGIRIGEFTVDFETTGSFRDPVRPGSGDEGEEEEIKEEIERPLDGLD